MNQLKEHSDRKLAKFSVNINQEIEREDR